VNIAVIGGGLAGLAAACELSDREFRVTLFEKRPFLGGKTYSFTDPDTGELVDNGQHVFMECTTAYIAFLRKLGTLGLARRQKRLRVRVFGPRGRSARLAAMPLPPPFHLAWSFARYRHLSLADRIRAGRLMLRAWRMPEEDRHALGGTAFAEWLRANGQSPAAIRDFWDFVLIPTLNCRSSQAAAADALFVLREGFLQTSSSAAVAIPAVGLSRLHIDPAVEYIHRRGGEIRAGQAVEGLEVAQGAVTGLRSGHGAPAAFDGYVLAVPHTKVCDLLPPAEAARPPFADLPAIPSSPIVNLHLWFDRPVADFGFAAFVGNELQWAFNRDRLDHEPSGSRHHLVVSLSAADEYMSLTKRELQDRFLPQVCSALPVAREATLLKFTAIKEPEATFVPAPGIRRPAPGTPLSNLVLAGAYTATGWPATMESAVRSGVEAARALETRLQTPALAATPGRIGS
jgi:squalene-associated FAD-dependent desaturase